MKASEASRCLSPGVFLHLSSLLLHANLLSSSLSTGLSPPQGSQGRWLPHRCHICTLQFQTHHEDDLILSESQ